MSGALSHLNNFFPLPSKSKAVSGKRKYEGGNQGGRRTDSFPLNNLSANKDIGIVAEQLRERAKFLYQNTTYAKRAINGLSNNVVGTGIVPTLKTEKKKALAAIKKVWEAFGEKTVCDFNGRLNFYGIEKLCAKTMERDGECLVLRRRVPVSESPIGIQYQVLEMEFLATYINYQILPGGGYTMNGIEYDKRGKVKFYWLFQRHPSEWWTQPEKVSADDLIHLLRVDFPAQNRGVSEAAASIITQRDLDEYQDAELMGKKVQASHAVFRITADPEKFDKTEDIECNTDAEHIEPGMIYNLFPGEDIKFNTPPTSSGTEGYVRMQERKIAAGYGVTYEQMTGDYSNVNFSSGRMGWIEASRNVEDLQWITLIPTFCDRAFGWFLEQLPLAPNTGIILLPEDLKVSWTTPRREMIDPVKETTALQKALRTGLISWQEVVKQLGYLPEPLFDEMKEDLKRFKDAGINAEWSASLDPKVNKSDVTPSSD